MEGIKYIFYKIMCNITWGKSKKYFQKQKWKYQNSWTSYKFTNKDIEFLKEQEKKYPKNILSVTETIRKIVKNKLSCARIGDGEFLLMSKGKNGVFNNANPQLQKDLIEICKNGSNDKCLVCINPFHLYNNTSRWFCWYFLKEIENIYKTISFTKNTLYGDAYAFWYYSIDQLLYIHLGLNNSECYLNEEHFEYIKTLWENRDVVFVCNSESGIRQDEIGMFSKVKSKNFITVPKENCYSEYDRIFNEITSFPKDFLIYLECGEVATVLAYKLSSLGYQALDIGNLYRRIVEHTVKKP